MVSSIRPPGPGSFAPQQTGSSSPLMPGMQQLGPPSAMGPPPPANLTGGSTSSPVPGTIPTSRPPSQVNIHLFYHCFIWWSIVVVNYTCPCISIFSSSLPLIERTKWGTFFLLGTSSPTAAVTRGHSPNWIANEQCPAAHQCSCCYVNTKYTFSTSATAASTAATAAASTTAAATWKAKQSHADCKTGWLGPSCHFAGN